MQSSLLSQFLLYMEDPMVVVIATAVVVAIRLLWVRFHPRKYVPAAPDAKPRKRRRPAPSTAPVLKKDVVLEVIDTVIIALVLVFGLVRPFLLQTFFIPSESMTPTLEVKDKLIANKFVLRFRTPRQGEIVVFRPPDEALIGGRIDLQWREWLEDKNNHEAFKQFGLNVTPEQLLAQLPRVPERRDDYIKRVVGIPGDRIRVEPEEGIFVNDKRLDEPYLPAGAKVSAFRFPHVTPSPSTPPKLEEYLAEAASEAERHEAKQTFEGDMESWVQDWYAHHMYEARIKPHVHQNEFVVPSNAVFVMGDNRSEKGSFDSRYWGVVELDDVRGRAVSTFWPLNRLKLL